MLFLLLIKKKKKKKNVVSGLFADDIIRIAPSERKMKAFTPSYFLLG
jgi:hypothetical protein